MDPGPVGRLLLQLLDGDQQQIRVALLLTAGTQPLPGGGEQRHWTAIRHPEFGLVTLTTPNRELTMNIIIFHG